MFTCLLKVCTLQILVLGLLHVCMHVCVYDFGFGLNVSFWLWFKLQNLSGRIWVQVAAYDLGLGFWFKCLHFG